MTNSTNSTKKITPAMKTTYTFSCQQCGECCWGKGGVRLNQDEAQRVKEFLHNPPNFTELYLEARSSDIRTGPDGFCIFHGAKGQCLIHPVKPAVCRNWPFLPGLLNHEQAFIDAQAACPGLARFLSWSDFLSSRQ